MTESKKPAAPIEGDQRKIGTAPSLFRKSKPAAVPSSDSLPYLPDEFADLPYLPEDCADDPYLSTDGTGRKP